jgi:hypothetical protein
MRIALEPFLHLQRQALHAAPHIGIFKIGWKRPPAHTAIRYILQGLNPADVERVFREHAADLNGSAGATGTRILAFDGKALKGSFDAFPKQDRYSALLPSIRRWFWRIS